jgi:hypothetical protein
VIRFDLSGTLERLIFFAAAALAIPVARTVRSTVATTVTRTVAA